MPKLREFLSKLGINNDKFDYLVLNQNPDISSTDIGTMCFNDEDKTLDIKITTNVTLQVGQEMHVRVVNKTGSTLQNGTVVYINNAQGNRPTVSPVSTSSYLSCSKIIGMVTEDILNNAEGFVTNFGLVRGLNTKDIPEGTILYLTSVAGTYSITRPTPPEPIVCVGIVVVEHVTNGIVMVKPLVTKNEFGDRDNGNYSYFENDGTFVMVGNSIVYNDLPPNPIIRSRQPATNNPTLATLIGNISQYTFAVNDYISDNLELMHEYKENSNFSFHIHWVTNGTNTNDRYVKWEIEYTIANTDSVFTSISTISTEVKIPANTPDRMHFVNNIGNVIVGTGLKIGAIICYNIKRITSSGTSPTSNPFGIQVSCHIQQDTLGSRQEYIK
jgi:hypothetical protein